MLRAVSRRSIWGVRALPLVSVVLVLSAMSTLRVTPVSAQMPGESEAAGVLGEGEPVDVLVLHSETGGARSERWSRDVSAALGRAGVRASSDATGWARSVGAREGTLDPQRVAALDEVAALIGEARAEAARLREGPALARLARAAQLVEAHADVPGSAAWAAEVWTATGVIAAQAGLSQLADVALARAATLDPRRGVRAAEASPEVVARAAGIARAAATGPTGNFEVVAAVEGARVLVDDGDVGAAPRRVRLAVGRHVVRVEAPGHRPFGQVVDVLEGERPPMVVRLAPDPAVLAAEALERAAQHADAPSIVAALAAIDRAGLTPPRVLFVEAGDGPRDRARLRDCTASGCEAALGLERDALPQRLRWARAMDQARVEARPDDAWIGAAQDVVVPPAATPWYARWYVWTIAGAVVAGAVTAGVLAQDPGPPTQRTGVSIDWGDGHE